MKVLKPGLAYSLENHGNGFVPSDQVLFFYGHIEDPTGIENAKYEHQGTTNEEVLKVLIARLSHQQAQQPCQESEQALLKLQEAAMWLNSRQSRMILDKMIADSNQ